MYRYWFMNLNNISIRKLAYIIEAFGTAEKVYGANFNDYKQLDKLNDSDINKILESKNNWNLESEWNSFLETGIGFVTIEDKLYPQKLRNIIDAPYGLMYKGRLPISNKLTISIIGARQRSAYGETIAQELGEALGAYDVQVISGLARGIDSDGHKGAIIGGAPTFAILGTGVDVIYPKGNKFLYEQILESGGGVISEFPLKTPAATLNFPRRNRIISGLSDYVVVIEAREKSGSLITAEFALEQGKEIYALPGRIVDDLSAGCNRLIHDGCGCILNVNDFLVEIGLKKKEKAKNAICTKNILEKEELLLYSLIDFTPKGIGFLLQNTSYSFIELMSYLDKMKRKGLIIERPSNFFVRAKNI